MKKFNFTGAPVIVVSFLVIAGALTAFDMNMSEKKLESVSPVEFAKNVVSDEGFVLVDVRTPEEYDLGHLPSAINVDYQSFDFESVISELEREGKYAIYCRSGKRSAEALLMMEEMGFKWVIDLSGGMESLVDNSEATEYFSQD